MILEMPFPVAEKATWDRVRRRGEPVSPYICDGVSFKDFAVTAQRLRGDKVKITYNMILANEVGVDKMATVRFTIYRGDKFLDNTVLRDIQVEEGRVSTRTVSAVVSASALTELPLPKLRITVGVENDE
jgi:hypothetical protein